MTIPLCHVQAIQSPGRNLTLGLRPRRKSIGRIDFTHLGHVGQDNISGTVTIYNIEICNTTVTLAEPDLG